MIQKRRYFVRFLLGGGVNTAATYCLFLLLQWIMPAAAAYTIAYIVGILLAYGINTKFVFQTKPSVRTALQFPAVYIVQYVSGLVFLTLFTYVGLTNAVAMLLVIVVNVPISFLLTRYVLRSAN
jgi:putative flippase GtrA